MPRVLIALLLGALLVTSATVAAAARATQAAAPIKLSGNGTDVVEVTLPAGTLVASSTHQGESNFIAYLVGPSGRDTLIANQIGVSRDEKVVEDVRAGGHRISVEADGAWTITLAFPRAGGGKRLVPSAFSGEGPKVIRVRLASPARPIVNASNQGDSNFIVYLVPLGLGASRQLVVNEIGPWSGRTLAPQLAAGTYLLEVEADGPWTLRFRR